MAGWLQRERYGRSVLSSGTGSTGAFPMCHKSFLEGMACLEFSQKCNAAGSSDGGVPSRQPWEWRPKSDQSYDLQKMCSLWSVALSPLPGANEEQLIE